MKVILMVIGIVIFVIGLVAAFVHPVGGIVLGLPAAFIILIGARLFMKGEQS